MVLILHTWTLDDRPGFGEKKQQSAMQLRQRCKSSQWMVVVFCPPPYKSNSYIVLYLDKQRGYQIVQAWNPTDVDSIWLPTTMSSVLKLIRNKKTNGSNIVWHELILWRSVGGLALTSPRQGIDTLMT